MGPGFSERSRISVGDLKGVYEISGVEFMTLGSLYRCES